MKTVYTFASNGRMVAKEIAIPLDCGVFPAALAVLRAFWEPNDPLGTVAKFLASQKIHFKPLWAALSTDDRLRLAMQAAMIDSAEEAGLHEVLRRMFILDALSKM